MRQTEFDKYYGANVPSGGPDLGGDGETTSTSISGWTAGRRDDKCQWRPMTEVTDRHH
jgi:hypothetical protein